MSRYKVFYKCALCNAIIPTAKAEMTEEMAKRCCNKTYKKSAVF